MCLRLHMLNGCDFPGLAAIRKRFIHKNLDINGYAWYNGRRNDDITHKKITLISLLLYHY